MLIVPLPSGVFAYLPLPSIFARGAVPLAVHGGGMLSLPDPTARADVGNALNSNTTLPLPTPSIQVQANALPIRRRGARVPLFAVPQVVNLTYPRRRRHF
jgi:hypothetical protein